LASAGCWRESTARAGDVPTTVATNNASEIVTKGFMDCAKSAVDFSNG